MKAFEYTQAQSVSGAVERFKEGKASRYLGGGVDLLGEMKDYLVEPDRVVDLKRIPGFATVERSGKELSLGAGVLLSRLEKDGEIRKRFPAIAEAARHVGSPQVRNMGTLGGNLAQHSRCWYYRHPDVECLKNGGDRCYARSGDSRYHCLFTENPCISPVVSNLASALMALGAKVHVFTGKGEEEWTLEDLYRDAWRNPTAHNSLSPGDLIVRVVVPDEGRRSHYLQQSDKADFDWALVSAAASARIEQGRLRAPRLVVGVIAPGPFQSEEVNGMLEGAELTEELAAAAAEKLLEGADATEENAYKVPLAKALARRCLLKLREA
jgi:xanthine dehydrogenase YagS FAD-binding subunit